MNNNYNIKAYTCTKNENRYTGPSSDAQGVIRVLYWLEKQGSNGELQ
jgi:hypothetical protein